MKVPLPSREKSDASPAGNQPEDVSVHLEPVPDRDGLLVSIKPPVAPPTDIPHVPCDIVLVIDVSGSMATNAPVPGEDATEDAGLSVLDLTKHAANTIIETMGPQDRLGIVTFSSKASVLQPLKPMSPENKATARKNIDSMRPLEATNLWHGILEGIKLFNAVDTSSKIPAIMILTDGMPNMYCPPNGYVPKLRSKGPLPATLHTFGFGYFLNSGLLKSIAEVGGGNYSFIPDPGMIGTVFVHAVANLQSTFATRATLKLSYPRVLDVQEATGHDLNQEKPRRLSISSQNELTVQLGNIQFGQTRDIFLNVKNLSQLEGLKESSGSTNNSSSFTATVNYLKPHEVPQNRIRLSSIGLSALGAARTTSRTARRSILDKSSLPPNVIAYHESRARLCNFLSSIFPAKADGERHANSEGWSAKMDELARLRDTLPAKEYSDQDNASLMEELSSEEPKGQIAMAIENKDHFHKWGCHYLPSLWNAHSRQICNSFKDPGPLRYGTESPLFKSCRDKLDDAFDNLPAPTPSRAPLPPVITSAGASAITTRAGLTASSQQTYNYTPISMSSFRCASGPCFAASTSVLLASGRTVEIRRLRRGVKVRTPLGPRRVAMVLKTPVERAPLCRIGDVLVTPWHPVSDEGKSWAFPANRADAGVVLYTGSVYSVLLERDRIATAHAMRVGQHLWGVTLGHGLTSGSDVRAHSFLGDYNAVGKSLVSLGHKGNGVVVGGGVERDGETGLVTGFKAPLQ